MEAKVENGTGGRIMSITDNPKWRVLEIAFTAVLTCLATAIVFWFSIGSKMVTKDDLQTQVPVYSENAIIKAGLSNNTTELQNLRVQLEGIKAANTSASIETIKALSEINTKMQTLQIKIESLTAKVERSN